MLGIIIGITFAVAFLIMSFAEKSRKHAETVISKKIGVPLAIISLLVGTLLGCIKTVGTGETGVVTTFGKVENYTFEAGVHFTNPLSRVICMDNRTQTQSLEINAFSSDIQEVRIVYVVNYSIDKANAQKIYKEIGKEYFGTIQPKIIESIKTVIAQYTAEDLVGARTEAARKIELLLTTEMAKYNVNLIGASLQDIDFTDEFTDAVEAKQVAEQNNLKAKTEAETLVVKAEAEAKVKLIEAEAQAQANELLTEALTEEILRKQAIEKWNGQLPDVMSDSNVLELTGLFN